MKGINGYIPGGQDMSKTQRLVLIGVLVSVEVVLSRFLSFSTWNMKIGFGFIPLAAAAVMLGPAAAAVTGGLSDFTGALLFPIGEYFPGFTLTAALSGAVLGLFLHREQAPVRIAAAVFINQFILGLLVNSYWIALLYGSPYRALLATRAVQSVVLSVVQYFGIAVLSKVVRRLGGRAAA